MQNRKIVWIGRVLSLLVTLPFLLSSIMKFLKPPMVTEGMAQMGLPASLLLPLAILEMSCVILYLIPSTAVLGAILLTGYIGGAMLTHLRMGQGVLLHIFLGVAVWGGLYFRDLRIRELIPLRKNPI